MCSPSSRRDAETQRRTLDRINPSWLFELRRDSPHIGEASKSGWPGRIQQSANALTVCMHATLQEVAAPPVEKRLDARH